MDLDIPASLEARFYPSDSIHRREIERHFGRRLLRDLSAEERDWLGQLDLFFVVFTNRSGSTYLTEILHQMGAGIHPRAEIFNRAAVLRWGKEHKRRTFTDYLLEQSQRYARNSRAGFKISIHQLFWFTRLGLNKHFRSMRFINSLREDPLDQAVSYVKAEKTGQWHTRMQGKASGPLDYSRSDIARSLLSVTEQRQLFDYYCALHRPEVLPLVYEDMLADPQSQILRLADFLGLPNFDPAAVNLDAVGIGQQRNEDNARLKATFIDEFSLD